MDTEEAENICTVWINREKRIISFRKEDGFAELNFSTYEEKLTFVIDKGKAGYAIQ